MSKNRRAKLDFPEIETRLKHCPFIDLPKWYRNIHKVMGESYKERRDLIKLSLILKRIIEK